MVYEVTDNRMSLNGFFLEQDTKGNIYIYDDKMALTKTIESNRVMNYSEFVSKCKELV